MKKNPISTKYEPLQESLVKKVGNLNRNVYKAIQKANAQSADELLYFMGAYIAVEFNNIRKATSNYLGVVKEDVKEISKTHDLSPNKALVNKMQSQTYIELNSNLVCAEKELMQQFKKTIKPYKQAPTHITDVKKALQNEFISNGGVGVTYRNGAKMPLDKYFMMATRTARNETQNATAIDNAIKLGTDYVFMAPNHSSCKTCSTLGNRIYCISGKDPNYPSVYNVLFKNGYTCIHPHCRCMLRPYFMENHTEKETLELQKASNRDYELDQRTETQRQQYQNAQAFNHRVWDATKEYNKAKVELGKDLPSQLNTLPKFRTAHAKKTPRYVEIHKTLQAVDKLPNSKPIAITEIKSNAYTDLPFPMKTTNLIITQKQYERHIAPGKNTHNDFYMEIKDQIPSIINNPDYIFKDNKNKNTILVIGKAGDKNACLVIKVSTITSRLSNTILTTYQIGNKRLQQMVKNNTVLYKK